MKENGVARYRAVATSAVREAVNADTLIDRVFVRSGIDVEVIDGAEENRLTYLAIREAVRSLSLENQDVVVVEVGGGSTDISFLRSGQPLHSGTFPLGSVRLRQSLQNVKADLKQRRKLLARQIKNGLDSIGHSIPFAEAKEMIALGGDIRFAARQITKSGMQDSWDAGIAWLIDQKDLKKFCDEIIKIDTDQMVRRYGLTYPEADTLTEALLIYNGIGERTGARTHPCAERQHPRRVDLDMVQHEFGKGLVDLEVQILASANELARKQLEPESHRAGPEVVSSIV